MKDKDFFEFKCEEMREIVEKVESGNYGIVYVQSVSEHQWAMIMDLEMQGYSIEEPYEDLDEEDKDEGYNPDNFILTLVSVRDGFGGITIMEITPELVKEVKAYQEWLRKKRDIILAQGVKDETRLE